MLYVGDKCACECNILNDEITQIEGLVQNLSNLYYKIK